MNTLETICLTIVGVAITMVGDIYLKRSNGVQHPRALMTGLLFYAIGTIPVAFIFRKMRFGNVFVLWEAMTIALALVVSRSIFREPITKNNWIALGLTILAMMFTMR